MIDQITEVDKSISNLSNSREIIFKQFILCNCNVEEFISKLYQINIDYDNIIFYIPTNFKETLSLVRNLYYTENDSNYNFKDITMVQPEIVTLQKYLIDNDIIKKYNVNILLKN